MFNKLYKLDTLVNLFYIEIIFIGLLWIIIYEVDSFNSNYGVNKNSKFIINNFM